MHDSAILVSIQHSRVPTLNLAENSYFGLAAGKGLRDTYFLLREKEIDTRVRRDVYA